MTGSASATTPPARTIREINLLALATALLCVALAWAGRTSLNPDGVSYLDIAARIAAGDWRSAAQGYWSPLYPALLAVVTTLTGAKGAALLAWVHATNGVIAIVAVAVIRRLALRHGDPWVARGLFAAFLLCSARTPRIDAVTPDLLLLVAIAALGSELLAFEGRRWLPLGLWAGVAFLAKTSSWPWLVVSGAVVALLSPAATRRTLWRAAAVTAGVMLLWVVPMSLVAGRPTLGSSGRLNACWYLERCDSRTPDTHRGTHERVGALSLADGETIAVADFTGTPWTYLPWSDPTAWEAGVGSRTMAPMDAADFAGFWARQLWYVLTLWTPHLLVGVLLPMAFLMWRPGVVGRGWREQRGAALTVLLGLVGVAQFVAVHAEPRLIAPFVLLVAAGVLWWLRPPGETVPARRIAARWVLALTWLGFVTALPRGVLHVVDLATRATLATRRISGLTEAAASGVPGGIEGRKIVVIGPAIPVISDAWFFGSTIVAQVPPGSADRVRSWTAAQQRELLALLGRGPGEVAWLSKADGSFQMAPIPRARE